MRKLSPEIITALFTKPATSNSLCLEDWESILLVLRKSQLLARVGLRLQAHGILKDLPDQVKRHFENAIALAERQHKLVTYEADSLVKYLSKITNKIFFLKGASYCISGSSAALGRVFSDIDVLVEKSCLLDVEKALLLAGWVQKEMNDYDDNYYREWAHEIPPMAHGVRGTILDLHHNIVPLVSGRAIDVNLITSESTLLGNGARVLSAPAATLHSAIHLFFNEDFSSAYRDMTDLYLLTHNQDEQFWIAVLELAKKTGFVREIALAIFFLKRHFNVHYSPAIEKLFDNKQFKVGRLQCFIFDRVLSPSHKLVDRRHQGLAEFLALVRGHWLKMPLQILVWHLTVKSVRQLLESVFGEHIFTKKSPEMTDNLGENIKK